MMTAVDCLRELVVKGVELWVEGDDLRYRAPRGVLTFELRETASRYRQEIVAALNKGVIKTIACPGDECDARVLLVNGQGYCPEHKMTVTVLDRTRF